MFLVSFEFSISAGFPSPAEGASDHRLSLDALVLRHPEATFFMKMEGSAMGAFGIFEGDILVIDRALHPRRGSTAVVWHEDGFLVRRLTRRMGGWCLESEEGLVPVEGETGVDVWGVVTHVLHDVR